MSMNQKLFINEEISSSDWMKEILGIRLFVKRKKNEFWLRLTFRDGSSGKRSFDTFEDMCCWLADLCSYIGVRDGDFLDLSGRKRGWHKKRR